jgi:hypothetical protein
MRRSPATKASEGVKPAPPPLAAFNDISATVLRDLGNAIRDAYLMVYPEPLA